MSELNRKSKKDVYHTLKTKTFKFEDDEKSPRKFSAHDAIHSHNELLNTSSFLRNKLYDDDLNPRRGPFSVANHEAQFGSTDGRSSMRMPNKMASLSEYKAKALDFSGMKDKLAQSQLI